MLTLQTPLHRSMATGSHYLTACAHLDVHELRLLQLTPPGVP